VRIVEGLRGEVAMRLELTVRFDYGSIVPWVRKLRGALVLTAGPDTLELNTSIAVRGKNLHTVGDFTIHPGERIPFVLNHHPSHEESLPPLDALSALAATASDWYAWSDRCAWPGRWHDEVQRSLITLKALIYGPTGGIVAAPTTSLPEQAGGVRNWDYRYCWLRDATFTLNALLLAGYAQEGIAWREWLLRAVAGSAQDLQMLYSVTGERRLDEYELDWLPGHFGARPARVGNAATRQFQLDVFGEVMDTLHLARGAGLEPDHAAWHIQLELLKFLEANWQQPDEGIWEVRGPRRQFTHSKIMAWVAFDRAIKDAEDYGLAGPVDRWRRAREQIHRQVCAAGFDAQRNTFVQAYDTPHLDASLLLIPQVGFLPSADSRVRGTIAAIRRELVADGLVLRYSTATGVDALPPGEGAFLPCSFWLADALILTGRRREGQELFVRLLALRNDVGLVAEEYDPHARQMRGNFPQALTHMALVNTAHLLSLAPPEADRICERGERAATAARAHAARASRAKTKGEALP
jgi:GH15 family glucan-1,4-alpha-glucosidase